MEQSSKETAANFNISLQGVHRIHLIPSIINDNMCEILFIKGSLLDIQHPRFGEVPLSSMHQNSRLPEGKKVLIFSINCIVRTESLGTVSQS